MKKLETPFIHRIQSIKWTKLHRIILFLILLAITASYNDITAQTTVFFDDFNRFTSNSLTSGTPSVTVSLTAGGTPSMAYTTSTTCTGGTELGTTRGASSKTTLISGADYMAAILSANSSATQISGRTYISAPLGSYYAGLNTVLSSNTGDITWTFNMRTNRVAALNGFDLNQNALAVVLTATSSNFMSADGYAVVENTGVTNNAISLVRFTGGLGSVPTIIGTVSTDNSVTTNFFSVKVVYTPSTNTWQLFVRDDGASKADPTTTSTQVTSTVNSTNTGVTMSHFGFFFNNNKGNNTGAAGNQAYFDDFKVTVNTPVTNTSGWPKAENSNTSGFNAKVNINVAGTSYYVVLPSGAAAPSSAQVKAGQNAAGTSVAANEKGTITCTAGVTEYVQAVSGLAGNTAYDVYFVAEDGSSANLQAAPTKVTVSTTSSAVAPTVTSPTATTITNTTAVLGGNISSDGASTILERGTVWKTTTGVTIDDNKLAEGGTSTGLFTQSRSSLPAKTQIFYKSYATNAPGTTLSTEGNFYTLANEPTAQVTTLNVAYASSTSVNLTWTAAADADGYIILQRAGATATTGTPTDATVYSVGTAIGNGTVAAYVTSGATTSQTITGLAVDASYSFKVFSVNSDGVNAGTYNYFLTSAPSKVFNPSSITSFTPTSAGNGTTVVITGVKFTGATAVSFGGTAASSFTINSDTQITAVVAAGTTGSVSVTTTEGVRTRTGFTWGEIPTLAATTAASSITTTSATSGGDVTLEGGSTVTARGICWSTSTAPTVELTTKTTETGTAGAFASNITGLLGNSTYYVRAYATNSFGTSYGAEISFTTLETPINISAGSTITENFDAIGVSSITTLPTGWKINKVATVQNKGSFVSSTGVTEYIGGNGLNTATNGLYNFGAGNASDATDRAIGGQLGLEVKSVNVCSQIKNTGSIAIGSFNISYNVEKYRTGNQVNGFSIRLFYSTNGSTWTDAGTDFLTSFATDGTNTGYPSAPGVTVSVSNKTLNQTLAAGSSIYLAWNYTPTTGVQSSASPALGIDDVSIRAVASTILNTGETINASSFTEQDLANGDFVVSNGEFLLNQASTTVKSLTVAPGAKVSVGTNTLIATNGITLESDASGTATLMDSYSTPTINATVKQYVTAGRNWYMSAPLNNSADYSVLNKGNSVAEYNEVTGLWPTVSSGTLTRGKGYVQVASASQGSTGTVSFAGTTNSGNVAVTLTNTLAGGKGYNLVGNPYPSYLSWSAVAADNGAANMPTGTMWYRTISYNGKSAWASNTAYSMNDIVYNGTRFYKVSTAGTSGSSGGPTGGLTGITDGSVVWNYEGSIYLFATISASGVASPITVSNLVPPMQAFWVKSSGGTLTFKNTMRSHNTGGANALKAPKNAESDIKLIRLNVTNGASADEAVIYASADASNAFDTYDAPKYFNSVGSNQPEIYTQVGNEKLVINAMNEINQGNEIPLGFATEKGNNFSISASEFRNFGSDTKVILKDKQTNTEFDLTAGQTYVFSSDVVNDVNRFSLIFRTSANTTGIDKTEILNSQVYVNAANHITIIAPEKSKYTIYNAMGQLLDNGLVNSKHEILNSKLIAGVYVVRVSENGNELTTRVIIK